MNIRRSIFAFLVTASAVAAGADSRQHYVVLERDRTPAFEVTRIHDQTPSRSRRTYLIADRSGPLLQIDLTNDYGARQTVAEYQLVRGSRPAAKVVLDLPVVSDTREGRREELRKNPGLADKPVPVTIHGSGKTMRAEDSEWRRSGTAETNRGRAKQLLGKELFSALADVRELAGLPMFSDLNASFGYIFEEASLVHRSMKLMVATSSADCVFDAKFGLPCAR